MLIYHRTTPTGQHITAVTVWRLLGVSQPWSLNQADAHIQASPFSFLTTEKLSPRMLSYQYVS